MNKVKNLNEITEFLARYSTMTSNEESFHSHRGCACCSEGIGNTVHNVTAYDVDGNKEDINLCIDCINYFFYCDIPERWIREREKI